MGKSNNHVHLCHAIGTTAPRSFRLSFRNFVVGFSSNRDRYLQNTEQNELRIIKMRISRKNQVHFTFARWNV